MATENKRSLAILESIIILVIAVGIVIALIWNPPEAVPEETEKSGEEEIIEVDILPFERAQKGLPNRGKWRGDPAAHDLNGDGHMDLVTSLRISVPKEDAEPVKEGSGETDWEYENGLYVFLGDGKGGFQISNHGIPPGLGYGGVEIADLNLDGNPDIAFSTHHGPMKAFLGDGKGSWTDASKGLDNEGVIVDLTAADFTGDGLPDIIGLSQFHERGGIYCFKNMGDGTWARMHEEPLMGPNIFGMDITSRDIDRDGDMDFAACTEKGLKIFLNDGSGNFTDHSAGLPIPRTGNTLTNVDFGDINGDGELELVVGAFHTRSQAGLEIYERVRSDDGSGLHWKRAFIGPYFEDYIFGLSLGDMDNDGDLDLVTSGFYEKQGARIVMYENNGRGTMSVKGLVEDASGRATIALADFDGDGRLDIMEAYSNNGGGVHVLFQR